MPLRKTEAIILRSFDYRETSKILTLYSRVFGKITVMAKGARNIKSRFGGSIEELNHVSVVFYEKENRDLQFLSQADVLATFQTMKSNLRATSVGLAVCELINNVEAGPDPNPHLFRLALTTLHCLDHGTTEPMCFFRAFQLHLCDLFGFRPTFSHCIECRKPVTGPTAFDLGSGGPRCVNCRVDGPQTTPLALEASQALTKMQRTHMSKLSGWHLSPRARQQIDDFLNAFLKYNIEGLRDLKSIRFLRKI